MNEGLKYAVCKIASNPKKAVAAVAAIVEMAPTLAVIGAVGAAGYGILKLVTKSKEKA